MIVQKVRDEDNLNLVYQIREAFCLNEYGLDMLSLKDDFDLVSEIFVMQDENNAICATARWRFSDESIVIDEIAIDSREKSSRMLIDLVENILQDLYCNSCTKGIRIELYCLPHFMHLYQKIGFLPSSNAINVDGVVKVPMFLADL